MTAPTAYPFQFAPRSPTRSAPRVIPWRSDVTAEPTGELLQEPEPTGRLRTLPRRTAESVRHVGRGVTHEPDGVELDLQRVELITDGQRGDWGEYSGEEIIVRLTLPTRLVCSEQAEPVRTPRLLPERQAPLFAQSVEAEWEEWQEPPPAETAAPVPAIRERARVRPELPPIDLPSTRTARPERVIVPVEKLFSGLSNALEDVMDSVVGRRPPKKR